MPSLFPKLPHSGNIFAMNIGDWVKTLKTAAADHSRTAMMLRPDFPRAPKVARNFLEPLVAVGAFGILLSLLALGMFSFATLMLCSALMYAILTQVFGLELSINA